MQANAHEILPGLWLGNRAASQDRSFLQANHITVIFNCTKDLPFVDTSLRLYRVPLDDNREPEELRNLELWAWEVVYKLHAELKEGRKALVHCYAGMQRSAAVVALYLMTLYRCTANEAIEFCRKRRPVAFFGVANFYPSLKGYEESFRRMIVEKNLVEKYPRIPLPTDSITNT